MKLLTQFAAIVILGAARLPAQTLDASGNKLLQGPYRFRHVLILNYDRNLSPSQTRAASGTITFDGAGSYTLTGSYVDNTVSKGAPQTFSATGKYVIGANGFGYVANPFVSTDPLWGSVAQGVFAGSDTEGTTGDFGTADLFVAIPAATISPAAGFTGTYTAGLLDFAAGGDAAIKNATFKLSFNGQGALGNIAISGQAANQTASSISQTSTAASYTFNSDGSATMNVPLPTGVTAANALFTGAKTGFISADGEFILGWSPGGYDIFFGIKSFTGAAGNGIFKGTYFMSGLEDTPQSNGVDSFYGSVLSPAGDGNAAVAERYESPFQTNAFDYGGDFQLHVNSDGSASDLRYPAYQYAFGDGGVGFVGTGNSGLFSLVIGLRASDVTPGPVFLSALGVLNAASYSPITAPLAPGQTVALFGSGLSSSALTASPTLSTGVGGVQVLIDSIPAPIYYVSSHQIDVQVPYELASHLTGFAQIQVNNAGTLSNTVTVRMGDAFPSLFTADGSGRGIAAATHADGTRVSASSPVQANETVSLYLTAMGTVTPGVADGAVALSNPLSNSDLNAGGSFAVFFDDYNNGNLGIQGTVTFAGLAPTFVGLYQVNVQVPAGVGPGNVYLNLQSDRASIEQVQLPIAAATSGARPLDRSAPPSLSRGSRGPRPSVPPTRTGSRDRF